MRRSNSASTKAVRRRLGRPRTTGKGVLIGGRWHAADLTAIDAWRLKQGDKPNRAEALRRLVRIALNRGAVAHRLRGGGFACRLKAGSVRRSAD